MTLQRLLDDLERLGREDAILEEDIDLETLMDYCAIIGLDGAKDIYFKLILKEKSD